MTDAKDSNGSASCQNAVVWHYPQFTLPQKAKAKYR